jgi:hypothetical protein
MKAGAMPARSTPVIMNDAQEPPAQPVRGWHGEIRKAAARWRRGSLVPRDDIVSGFSSVRNPGQHGAASMVLLAYVADTEDRLLRLRRRQVFPTEHQ